VGVRDLPEARRPVPSRIRPVTAEHTVADLDRSRSDKRASLERAGEVARYVQSQLEPYSDFVKVVDLVARRVPAVEVVALPVSPDAVVALLQSCGFTGDARKQSGTVAGVKTTVYLARDQSEAAALASRVKPGKKKKASPARRRARLAGPSIEPDGFNWGGQSPW